MVGPRFELGLTVITAAARELLTDTQATALLTAHVRGDWGELSAADEQANEDALEHGGRLLSKYVVDGQPFYVITEWDRSYTTILRTEDY